MKIKFMCLSACFLALAACGSAKKSPDDPNNKDGKGGHANNKHLSEPEFRKNCGDLNGTRNSDYQTCFVQTHQHIVANGDTSQSIELDPAPQPGNRVDSSVDTGGNASSVSLYLNGDWKANAGSVYFVDGLNSGNNTLTLSVHHSGSAASTFAVYQCYDKDMNAVSCKDRPYP